MALNFVSEGHSLKFLDCDAFHRLFASAYHVQKLLQLHLLRYAAAVYGAWFSCCSKNAEVPHKHYENHAPETTTATWCWNMLEKFPNEGGTAGNDRWKYKRSNYCITLFNLKCFPGTLASTKFFFHKNCLCRSVGYFWRGKIIAMRGFQGELSSIYKKRMSTMLSSTVTVNEIRKAVFPPDVFVRRVMYCFPIFELSCKPTGLRSTLHFGCLNFSSLGARVWGLMSFIFRKGGVCFLKCGLDFIFLRFTIPTVNSKLVLQVSAEKMCYGTRKMCS